LSKAATHYAFGMHDDRTPFAEAARFYGFRAPYAPQAFAHVRDSFRLGAGSRLLDLGCGPGNVAIPMSRMVGHVLAIDRSRAMLEAGRARAAQAGRRNIEWLCARAEDISEALGRFDVVTLGQSFHWMDRHAVLRQLARMIAPGGGVVLVSPGRRRPQESWETAADEVLARYLGPRTRHPEMNPDPKDEPALLSSETFSQLEMQEFPIEFERDVPSVLGCIYSMSTSPRSAFGERIASFERDLTAALMSANPAGVFKERVETEVLVARKGSIEEVDGTL
jgi:ubiquinone/menaquinone biosynthesis C-methylase UbiE